jgi:hypothetical protein
MESYIEPSSSSSIWHWLMWWMDFLTGPRFGVLVAFAVIVFLQFKPNIVAFFSNLVENGVKETLLDYLLGLCDLVRAYYQIACEAIRNFVSSGASSEPTSAIGLLNTTATSRASRGSAPPPLVIQPLEIDAQLQSSRVLGSDGQGKPSVDRSPSPSGSSSSSITQNAAVSRKEIEPAFLDDKDYPQGWLVYHSTLGVTSKEEADRFDRTAMITTHR